MFSTQTARWVKLNSTEAVELATLESMRQAAQKAIEKKGRFDLVLAGGTTPKNVYQRLIQTDTDWSCWHIWFGDERCLPCNDEERNSVMAASAWLDHVAIPKENIYIIPTELGAAQAAVLYSEQLSTLGAFDLVLLGMGEDGHTASLFPGKVWHSSQPAIAVYESPKPPSDRVSISAERLSNSQQVIFIITGASKKEALAAWQAGAELPVSAITPKVGVDVFIDPAASSRL